MTGPLWIRLEKASLRKMALKIEKIPSKYATFGRLDLDKVHHVLAKYQGIS